MRKSALLWVTLVALGLVFTGTSLVEAQLRNVLDLNRQGMEAYNNLELEQAENLLLEALNNARANNVSGSALARTYVNLGVVAIGGNGDNAQGMTYFERALASDCDVQLDPLTSTPQIRSVFTLATNRSSCSGGGGGGSGTGGTGGGTGTGTGGGTGSGTGTTGGGGGNTGGGSDNGGGGVVTPSGPSQIPHRAIEEQLTSTAVPVFIEVPRSAPVGDVSLYYQTTGMREYRRVQMQRMAGGFGYEIPCSEVFQPIVKYYIVADHQDGSQLGYAGSEERPLEVPIVSTRSTSPPALPGRAPPTQCRDDECPPGMECDNAASRAGLGNTCTSTPDCAEGLTCHDDLCVAEVDDGSDEPSTPSDRTQPWFFAHVGFAGGAGYASEGRPADTEPTNPGTEISASYLGPQTNPADPGFDCAAEGGKYCVRIDTPGFLPALALRAVVGVWVIPRLAIAANFRYQFSAGEGSLSNMMIGLRAQVQLTTPAAEGLNADFFIGSSFGQIQLQAPQGNASTGEKVEEPYIISGLNSVQLGFNVGYRFHPNVGITFSAEMHVMFPVFMIAIDPTLSLEFVY